MSDQGMDDFLNADDSSDISQVLDERIDRRIAELRPIKNKSFNLPLGIAAGLLMLLAAYALFFGNWRQSTSDRIFAEHFVPFEDVITTDVERGVNVKTTEIGDVMQQYNQGRYAQFLNTPTLDDLSVSAQPLLAIYKANALMKLDRVDEAVSILKTLNNSLDKNPYQDITQWYLALAYVHQGQNHLAQQLLMSITSAKGHYKKKQAQALLAEIDTQK